MPRIQCPWIVCKHNTGECDIKNHNNSSDFGECNFEGVVDLHDGICDECGAEGEILTCESFETKVWDKDGNRVV